ncbi:Leucine rich repeat-containing protein [Butyrivibrio sp. ob235]|uniref:leucine-rich repeat protein n=1 Tax=Butyrivibrio sp. ob235 TaxID=1761780 RepID=UPI0008D0631B|nr:leucine-rich repeat protein [Butyrivibrio sp. ob235]SEM60218.1 Leucine rich repeat-containing protein [Butyrivibrio sp. ob235]
MNYKFEETTDEKNGKYLIIKGCEDSCRQLVIPESDSNLVPVRIIGNHAFSSRDDLVEVAIPNSVHTILGFAFHNCGNLKKISLTDSVTEYLDGGTRQCESLEEIEVFLENGNNYIIRRILEDNDRRLTFRMHMPDGEALLVFPGFNYDFVENTMARTIQFAIEGTGYAYRECVKSDQIGFREYDNLFSKVSADDKGTAEMIAMARILAPYELSEDARIAYEKWLLEHALKSLTIAVDNEGTVSKGKAGTNTGANIGTFDDYLRDTQEHTAFYLERKLITKADARKLAHIAADRGITAIVSMLMDYAETDSDVEKSGDEGVTNRKDDNILELDF